MSELADIIAAYHALARDRKPMAMAMVVGVEGSAYRKVGARMLIAEDGRTWGGISGGCLERDVVLRSLAVMSEKVVVHHQYETADDEQLITSSASTGCGGTVDVLIHPYVDEQIQLLEAVVTDRREQMIATIIHATGAWRSLVGRSSTNDWPIELRSAIEGQRSGTVVVASGNATAMVLIESILPTQELVIFGAGPDVVPILQIAKTLGWYVTVVAAPPATHSAERLRLADKVLINGADDPLKDVTFNTGSAVILVTHNLARDRAILEKLPRVPSYLGILGPRHRTQKVVNGLDLSLDDRSVYSPIGLDLGAKTPDEIAVSIISEIIAWRNDRGGAPLREKDGANYSRPSFQLIASREER